MHASNVMVIHYVYDMSRAIAFYRDALGLPIISESAGWSMLSCGDAIVALHILDSGMSEGPTLHAGLCLQVEKLEPAIEDIRQAGGILRTTIREAEPPRVPVRVAEVQDSEGNAFELREYVS